MQNNKILNLEWQKNTKIDSKNKTISPIIKNYIFYDEKIKLTF